MFCCCCCCSRSANEYSFDAVFPPEAGQSEVNEGTAKPHIAELLEGINVTVFAYGGTGELGLGLNLSLSLSLSLVRVANRRSNTSSQPITAADLGMCGVGSSALRACCVPDPPPPPPHSFRSKLASRLLSFHTQNNRCGKDAHDDEVGEGGRGSLRRRRRGSFRDRSAVPRRALPPVERAEAGSGQEDETETWSVRVGYLQVRFGAGATGLACLAWVCRGMRCLFSGTIVLWWR